MSANFTNVPGARLELLEMMYHSAQREPQGNVRFLPFILKEDIQKFLPRLNVGRFRSQVQIGIAETLEDIGDKLGLTRERIRQIEAKSLNRLRRIVGSSLKEFITTKATANITAQHGFLNEEELVGAFGDDCSSGEAALALNLLRDLEGVTDLFAGRLVEVEPGVYCASAETASEYKIGAALIQATLADNRVPIDEQQL